MLDFEPQIWILLLVTNSYHFAVPMPCLYHFVLILMETSLKSKDEDGDKGGGESGNKGCGEAGVVGVVEGGGEDDDKVK